MLNTNVYGIYTGRGKNLGAIGLREPGMEEFVDKINGYLRANPINFNVKPSMFNEKLSEEIAKLDLTKLYLTDIDSKREINSNLYLTIGDILCGKKEPKSQFEIFFERKKNEIKRERAINSGPKWVSDLQTIVKTGIYEI